MVKSPKARPKKVVASSWSDEGPLSVAVEVSGGSAQMFWLRFWRRDFTADAFIKVADAETLHAQLGAAIAAAKAELAACAGKWAEQMVADTAVIAEPDPTESQCIPPPPPAAG